MPIFDHLGQPVRSATPAPFDFTAPIRQEKVLSLRSAEILRSITLWEMSRRLTPLLLCRDCYDKHPNWSDRDKHTVEIASTATGSILAQCDCTSWVCAAPVPLDTSDIPANVPELITLVTTVPLKKQRPINPKEARLLQAWRSVMQQHRWLEILWCMDCAKKDPLTACKCAVIPDKSVTVDCACSERRWTGVTK